VIQPDGKIVVVGRADEFGADDWGAVRYNTDGSLDTSFGSGGKITTGFGGDDAAYGVVVQPDGKIVVAGSADASGADDFGVVRYNPNGALDTGFSGDGKQTTDFGGNDPAFEAVVQSDGKIVVGGATDARGTDDFALARYNADGSLDHSYSHDGLQTTDFRGSDAAQKIAIQPDDKVVAVGSTQPRRGGSDFALARYGTNGSLDTSFSGDGLQTTDLGSSDDAALGVAIQPDGKIVLAGISLGNFGLARYQSNGALDPAFSGDGTVTTTFGGYDLAAGSMAIQPDGKIVAAGGTETADQDFALARYTTGGVLDSAFDGDGLVTTDFPP